MTQYSAYGAPPHSFTAPMPPVTVVPQVSLAPAPMMTAPGVYGAAGASYYAPPGGGSVYGAPPGSMVMPGGYGGAVPTASIRFPIPRVKVIVEEARDVAKKDFFGLGSSDPYCMLAFKTEQYTSRTCRNTQNPVWYEDFFIHDVHAGDELCIALWDSDRFKKDDFLGEVRVFAKDFSFFESRQYRIMPRRGQHDRVSGTLRLRMEPA
jgi:hypothetical protein